ncbi:ABC transporter substrate-binding protein [Pseudonocardia abyssalis]|uniref:Iron-siderophore ABC transporter substrate-binding protein n=1 Tax=Pseudonocardia abyssalis TaxID=2792008 RepID=A0ABS6UXS6_9PSEU|nr:iron-siderophore ABC transporter substrate-binding protein [Pseudonocardia abyssalis]MBW0119068.1 iron-siderophore ABC transporter substrate-binding protein [Pseudonocardia abyssalis]MBW0137078.1 iron-siderophore ABC transporter substrate-binding protein [Pseudonocardia abyssalis]
MRQRTAAVAALVVALAVSACSGPTTESEPAGETRSVVHARGTAEIVGTPERVVVLDTGELDSVLALGVTPVGAVEPLAGAGLMPYLGERTAGIEIVGTIGEPNLEAIAALAPDLILSSEVRHADLYDQLSAIAPTVFAETVGVVWKENLRLAADALGVPDEADRLLAGYSAKAAATGSAFGDPSAVAVSMIRFTDGTVRLYGTGSFIGTLLADSGFARPVEQQADEVFVEVSAEQLSLADGDLLFYGAYGAEGAEDLTAATAGPLWSTLPAVAQGRAHEIDDDLWYLGIGPIAAGQVLDELAAHAPA